ncbi:E3 ubiquitin-protein ligase rbbp6 [Mortierella alpina]|nr:E3 ubiquitin-protein ligase rbbp6 [Mortierella alpina]
MSQVHYKFKSSKDYDSATFDGHSISVFDLKKEILIAKGLKGPDDLALTHAESGEEYYDDATLIPRNTSILVARVPAKPGRGGAQRYLEGAGPIPRGGGMTRNVFERPGQNSQQDAMGGGVKVYKNTTSLLTEDGPPAPAVDTSHMTEEERTKFVFEQAASYWDKTQEGMASAPYRPLGKFQGATRNPPIGGQKPGGAPAAPGGVAQTGPYQRQPMEQQQRPPPNTYVCYRCGKKGEHWIQFCPTNNDKSFEPIGIKKTTGIPRSFLKTVESDTLQSKKGVMVTQDGNLVVATTNDYEWKKFHEKSKGTLTSEEAYSTAPVPDDMRCPICHLMLKSAVQAPCCGTNFCDECIRTYLVHPPKGEDPFKCQNCSQYLVPDQLMPNAELRQRVEQHLRDWAKNRRGASDGNGVVTIAAINSRGGTPHPEAEGTGPRSGAAGTFQAENGSTLSDDMNIEEDSNTEAGQKRKLSSDNGNGNIDHQGAVVEGEHSRDHASWKNKKHHATNSNGNFNPQAFNRNRPPMHGPGTVGPMDPSMMFPEALPPGFLELMQQHDPGLFMDPAFMGPNSVPPFMMPGFMPQFGPEMGGIQGARGPGGPDLWGIGRGLPGLPPMGPGHPTPRIGFSDGTGPGAGRGRGRGGWQDNGNSGNIRGPVQMHSIDRSSQEAPQVANQAGDSADSHVSGTTGDVTYTGSSPGRTRMASRGRFEDDDDDIDMSQVPTGPRASRRLSIEDDEDIPKGPRAGPDADYDRTSDNRRSESPPRAPLADRLRQRSSSKARKTLTAIIGTASVAAVAIVVKVVDQTIETETVETSQKTAPVVSVEATRTHPVLTVIEVIVELTEKTTEEMIEKIVERMTEEMTEGMKEGTIDVTTGGRSNAVVEERKVDVIDQVKDPRHLIINSIRSVLIINAELNRTKMENRIAMFGSHLSHLQPHAKSRSIRSVNTKLDDRLVLEENQGQSTDKGGRKGRRGYGGNEDDEEKYSDVHRAHDDFERGVTDPKQNLAVTGLVSSSARERERRERERRGSYD